MAKLIVVPRCDFMVHGADGVGTIVKMAEHLVSAHGVEHLSDQLKVRIPAALRDD